MQNKKVQVTLNRNEIGVGGEPSPTAVKRESRVWGNPYREIVDSFPGRLFCGEDFQQDCAEVSAICAGAEELFVEIGSGSGAHLLEVARRSPKAACFGFELRFKRSVRTIQKAQLANIENIYVLRMKGELVSDVFQDRKLDGVFVNFPEPWEKLKQRKHRVLGVNFLNQMSRLLAQDGFISVKTDHLEYYRSFVAVVRADSRFRIQEETEDLFASEYAQSTIPSEFESLFRKKEEAIKYVLIRRALESIDE
jgi:tRNA (guanine-N7-)-methyltransferase